MFSLVKVRIDKQKMALTGWDKGKIDRATKRWFNTQSIDELRKWGS